MRLKSVLSVFVAFVLVLVFTQNAFAMTGIGDTKENAIALFPETDSSGFMHQRFDLYIDSASDQDWFKWKNTTGENLSVFAAIQPKDRNSYLRVGMIIQYPSGQETTIFYSDPSYGPGNAQTLSGFYLPPGATVYIKVDSRTFGTPCQYMFIFELTKFL
ncbi:hypothetical protein [Paenibacillus dendritiformis]|uniref:hypothetical protein n=1 Tax=Paenibacillus dendritiformis TaxID=130049 RepID=UPI0020C442E8|nr:hypothetical protein [Paenibacillus dendritiformis]CAH8770202.1 hypothetical protein H7S4_002937 [Paenibacillus dendritiformis]